MKADYSFTVRTTNAEQFQQRICLLGAEDFSAEMTMTVEAAARLMKQETPVTGKREYFNELNSKLLALFRATGCIVHRAGAGGFIWEYAGQPPVRFEEVVKKIFVRMFTDVYPSTFSNDSDFSLFAGAGWGNRWEACLRPPCDPHLLAARLVRITKWAQSDDAHMSQEEQNSLLPILNGWCKPQTPWTILPGTREICTHLFGQAWWDIYRPDLNVEIDDSEQLPSDDWENWDFHFFTCHELIRNTRPPFLSGVLPDYQPLPQVALPDLDY